MAGPEERSLQAAHELGKIYSSFVDKNLLCDFFLESALLFFPGARAFLFLVSDGRLRLEAANPEGAACPPEASVRMRSVYESGKPERADRALLIPLIVRSSALGIVCIARPETETAVFTQDDLVLASDLGAQAATALKNILLFEQNLHMERLSAVGQAMSMVMHELKNLTQMAKFSEEYLRRGLEQKNERFLARGMEGMAKAVREMDGFGYEVLSLTKDYAIQPEALDMAKLFEELRQDFETRAQQLGVALEFQVEKDFPAVEAETRPLYRALVNLIKNAFEASSRDKPAVKVSARLKDAAHYEITVEDNGEGMSEEVRSRLFHAFFSTKGSKGTGLGLLIVQRTVMAHGGRIDLDSAPGRGTRFILTLPRKQRPAAAPPKAG